MKAILTVGLPGSGKTTWAKKFVEDNPDYVRISREDLRNMRGKYWIPKQEVMITDFVSALINEASAAEKNIVLDETNLNESRRNKVKEMFHSIGYNTVEKWFLDPVDECIKRDLARLNSVGADVIWGMYDNFVRSKDGLVVPDLTLPPAVIFDIDGTLALNKSGRSPFDWSRIKEDEINSPVRRILFAERNDGTKIIIFSGRDLACQVQTQEWLIDNFIYYDTLCMRFTGDMRSDEIVKREMFDGTVRGKYNVLYWVDDRDKVVRMVRKDLGLTCLQVNYGNF